MKFENKKRLIPMPYKSWFCLFLAASVCFVAGCGQSGTRRYNVEGTVTIGGKPVPAGEVRFEPDPPRYQNAGQSSSGRGGSKAECVETHREALYRSAITSECFRDP